jgi:DNA-binding response OmpR family regulator
MSENKKKNILIAEDDQMISSMYKTKFNADGYNVFIADNGTDALNIAKKEKIDLILLDIIMPQLDGFSVLRELKKISKFKKTPIVLLTNLGTEEDMKKGKELGAKDYIVKASFTPADISKKVKEYLK